MVGSGPRQSCAERDRHPHLDLPDRTRTSAAAPAPAAACRPSTRASSPARSTTPPGSYSPFNLRLTRNDGEQEFTNFSIKLPPGVIGKLAGVPFCSDAAIAAGQGSTGPHGGRRARRARPARRPRRSAAPWSAPASARVLTYVPGKVYLAGPYNGSPLSIVAITAAKVGPFDLGTVVVRQALRVNPETAEVFIDATGSDPIPHIIEGIPVHLRDIRVYVDRPEFVLNPTNCDADLDRLTVLGSGLDFASAADDNPVTVDHPLPGGRLRRARLQAEAAA